MARIICCSLLSLLTFVPSIHAAPPQPDGIALLLSRLEQAVRSGKPDSYQALVAASADAAAAGAFAESVIRPGATRAVVRERDRAPLSGALSSQGYQLTVEAFVEFGSEARVSTWAIDVKRLDRRADAADDGQWGIVGQRVLGTVPSIHRLHLDESRQFTARQLVVSDEDLQITIPQAVVFVAEAGGGPAALVVLGRARLRFAPTQAAERGQVRAFARSETIETDVDGLFVRLPPDGLEQHVSGRLEPAAVNTRLLPRAVQIFQEEVERSYGLDLGDLADGSWSLLPSSGDFLAEIRTRKFGTLTYLRSSHDAEDISLFQRDRRRNIAVYSSAARLASRGRFYSDDDGADYKVKSYDIETSFDPGRNRLAGRTRLLLQVTAPSVSSLTLRLADALVVTSVSSPGYGRLLSIRSRGQNSLVVSLPAPLSEGAEMTVDVGYAGVVVPQPVGMEAIGQVPMSREVQREVRLEESFLYSNQTFWYPQAPGNGFSTATMRVRVPEDYWCVASGQLTQSPDAAAGAEEERWFTFVASRPARYFACLISRLVPAASRVVTIDQPSHQGSPHEGEAVSLTLEVKANPRLRRMGKPIADTAGDIVEFYGSLIGAPPYPEATIVAVEWKSPGGHSPAYMAVLNQTPPGAPAIAFRDDPAYFEGFPQYYLAHELAHQWWGQAVGWKNYHEQWLSEGLAQYFAALYARHSGGESAFEAVMRSCRQWSMRTVGEGPIYLGYRVGHIKGDPRLFRAVVYNKSAAVLDMLRRMVGDDAFFRGLRRYYSTWRFRKAGSDDLRQAMQQESGMVLDRFFERWIYGDGVPSVSYSTTVEGEGERREAVVRFYQAGAVYDFPVTVTVHYADRASTDVTTNVTGQQAEVRIPLSGRFKRVEVNRDGGALGTFRESKTPKS